MLKASALFAVLVAVATMPGINAIQPGQADLQDPPEALANPYPTGGGVNSNENSGNSGGGDEASSSSRLPRMWTRRTSSIFLPRTRLRHLLAASV